MNLRKQFLEIKRLFFPRWDHDDLWRISTRSRRRRVHGYCDAERRVIEIVIQHADPDKSDCLLIHEICHAVAKGGHGKVWQQPVEPMNLAGTCTVTTIGFATPPPEPPPASDGQNRHGNYFE